ncbi:hypothetical protein DPSP01_012563 [Paraphaeosphaeria sporulosa]
MGMRTNAVCPKNGRCKKACRQLSPSQSLPITRPAQRFAAIPACAMCCDGCTLTPRHRTTSRRYTSFFFFFSSASSASSSSCPNHLLHPFSTLASDALSAPDT